MAVTATNRNGGGEGLPLASAPSPWLRLPLLLGAAVLGLGSCSPLALDYSEYAGTNLIPGRSLDAMDTTPAPYWLLEDPDTEGNALTMPEAENSYLLYEQVDGVDNGGYADEATLRLGLGAEVPATEPIFRLEVKSLLTNGDLEAGGTGPVTSTGTLVSTTSAAVASGGSLDGTFDHDGDFLYLDNAVSDEMTVDLTVIDALPTTRGTYTLGFDYRIKTAQTFTYALASTSTTVDGDSIGGAGSLNNNTVASYRFPFSGVSGEGGTTGPIDTSDPDNYRYFILDPNAINTSEEQAIEGTFDNFYLIPSEPQLALRSLVPWTETGRPVLQQGGRYTLRVWVRDDATAGAANRFAARHFTMGLTRNTSVASGATYVVHTGPWSAWTELTATFSSTLLGSMDTTGNALQILLSTTNSGSESQRAAGSLLLTYPRLYWSPE